MWNWFGDIKQQQPRQQVEDDEEEEVPLSSTSSINCDFAASPYWLERSPHHSVKKKKKSNGEEGFSPFVAFCFTINYVLGTGFLTLPWAFVQGGLVLSAIALFLAAIVADVTKDYLLETMARAESMVDHQMHWIVRNHNNTNDSKSSSQQHQQPEKQKDRLPFLPLNSQGRTPENGCLLEIYDDTDGSARHYGTYNSNDDTTNHHVLIGGSFEPTAPISSRPSTSNSALQRLEPHDSSSNNNNAVPRGVTVTATKYLVKNRKFEVNTLCRIFLGKFGLRIYTTFICLYMCGLLWAYTSVFASALARAAPISSTGNRSISSREDGTDDDETERLSYTCYAFLFGTIVVPLSCLELEEQVNVQVFLTGCRFVMLFLMLGTANLCAKDMMKLQQQQIHDNSTNSTGVDTSFDTPLFQPNGLYKMLPIVAVANMYHHSIPGLSKPVGDKKNLGNIFQFTCIFTTLAYSLLGIVLGSAFGKQIEQSSNLNCTHFHAGTGHYNLNDEDEKYSSPIEGAALWTEFVSWFIICFPAIDVVSAFPLNAITVANSMFCAYYGKRIHDFEDDRWRKLHFRLLATIPPIALGLVLRELGVITDYTGTTGFVIGLSIPAILYIRSRQQAEKRHYKVDTYYTSYGSSYFVAYTIFWFGLIMVVGVFSSLLLH